MNRKVLIITYTYYQLIVAVQLKRTVLCDDCVDIIITDHSNGCEETAKRLKKKGVFQNVFFIRDDDGASEKTVFGKAMRYMKARIFPRRTLSSYMDLQDDYELFFFSTASLLVHLISFCFRKRIKCYRFEDGYSTYTRPLLERKPFRRMMIRTAFGDLRRHIQGLYLFRPELFTQKIKCPVLPVKLLDKQDVELKRLLNEIFDYNSRCETYSAEYIFFEESFRASGINMDDVELMHLISDAVGRENLLIKQHPRNKQKLSDMGDFKTNSETGLPWELILINEDFSGKTLLTITSGAALASAVFCFESVKIYLLFNCVCNKSPMLDNAYLHYISQLQENVGNIIIPENKDTFLKQLKEYPEA